MRKIRTFTTTITTAQRAIISSVGIGWREQRDAGESAITAKGLIRVGDRRRNEQLLI